MNIATLVQVTGTLGFFVFFALLVMAVVRTGKRLPTRGLWMATGLTLIVAVIFSVMGMGLVYVESNERGVVKTIRAGGVRPQTLEPGLHWILPVVEQVVNYSISNQTYTMSFLPEQGPDSGEDSIRARTKDGQEVIIDGTVIYRIDPAKVVQLHIAWQENYEAGIVRPETRGAIRDAVAQYGVEEVVSTKREEMVQIITNELKETLEANNLELLDFILRDIHFSEEYAAAVEQKQIAEQQALQAALVVEQKKQEAEQARQEAQGLADAAVIKAKGEAEARIIQAEAEAKANALIAASLAGHPELLTYLYISKIAPNIQVMFLPSNAPFIFPFPDMVTQ